MVISDTNLLIKLHPWLLISISAYASDTHFTYTNHEPEPPSPESKVNTPSDVLAWLRYARQIKYYLHRTEKKKKLICFASGYIELQGLYAS